MKIASGLILIIIGIALILYLALYVMLYGGIMAAIDNWGANNSAVVWGIIRAIFAEFGVLPGMLFIGAGWLVLKD